jgi:hypothetical protein
MNNDTPSPEAMEAALEIGAQGIFNIGGGLSREGYAQVARIIDAKFASLRQRQCRKCHKSCTGENQSGLCGACEHERHEDFVTALCDEAKEVAALSDRLRMREEQLEALTLRWWSVLLHGDGKSWSWHTYDGKGTRFVAVGPHDQLPPWPEAASKALAEQRSKQ